MSLTIVRAVQTCFACPSQWDAWTEDGTYLYLRYRGGIGTVNVGAADGPLLASFGAPSLDGVMDLDDFLHQAGIRATPEVEAAA